MIKESLLVIYYLPQQLIGGYLAVNHKPASRIIVQILTTKEANRKKLTYTKYALFVRKNKILGFFLPSSPATSIRVFLLSNCWRYLILLEHSGHSTFTP